MRYVLLVYDDEAQMERLTGSERQALDRACRDNDDALRQRGSLLTVETLQGRRAAATVRIRHGILAVTAGPVRETVEQLIACYILEARDLNEAIQIAAQMPQAQVGPIEVRPAAVADER